MPRLLRSIAFIKTLHAAIGIILVGCVLYVLVAAIADQVTILTWIAYALMIGEVLILIRSGWKCPLTTYTEGLGAEIGSVTNLFLPGFLARRLFAIFKILLLLCTGLLIFRFLT